MVLTSLLQRYGAELEAELQEVIGQGGLYDMLRYHLGWADQEGGPGAGDGGKRLRPMLCLLTCEALGGDWRRAIPAAAALELVHNFSLIHDDIEDRSPQRRHRPTVWRLWGEPLAINAGDAMFVLARKALWRLAGRGTPPATVLALAQLLDDACLALCEGQHLDLSYERCLEIGVDDYLTMIRGKTEALIACSLRFGAIVAGASPAVIAALGHCGEELGLAFQIQDDVLGVWGEEEVTGKPRTADIAAKKKTLPVVYALGKAQGHRRERLLALYQKGELTADEVEEVLGHLDALAAREFAQAMAQEHLERALQHLDAATPPSTREPLRALARFLIERQY